MNQIIQGLSIKLISFLECYGYTFKLLKRDVKILFALVGTILMVITITVALHLHTIATMIMIVVVISSVATLMAKDNARILIILEVSALQIAVLALVFNQHQTPYFQAQQNIIYIYVLHSAL